MQHATLSEVSNLKAIAMRGDNLSTLLNATGTLMGEEHIELVSLPPSLQEWRSSLLDQLVHDFLLFMISLLKASETGQSSFSEYSGEEHGVPRRTERALGLSAAAAIVVDRFGGCTGSDVPCIVADADLTLSPFSEG